MWLGIVALFPEMFEAIANYGVTGRAGERGLLEMQFFNPRDFATDKHRTVDDKPYGGGPGMLMKVAPLRDAIQAAKTSAGTETRVIYLSPQGKRLEQDDLARLATFERLILVAGRYEGIDERVIEAEIDEEFSIGDYVVSGGELPAMVLIDGISRLLPGVVGDPESVERDSFIDGVLDYPQYTRPEEIDGAVVPKVLLSGNHEEIDRWRLKEALGRTFERRPDLIEGRQLTKKESALLDEYVKEHSEKGSNASEFKEKRNND